MSDRPVQMEQFEPLIGAWRVEALMPFDPPVEAHGEETVEWLGEFLVLRAAIDMEGAPDSICVVGGSEEDEQLVHYFDERGVARRYLTSCRDGVWRQRRHPGDDWHAGPGFDQRFIGELSADGSRIDGRWEKCDDGADWELDFEINYLRN